MTVTDLHIFTDHFIANPILNSYPKTQLCKICTLYIPDSTVRKTEFDLLIARIILLNWIVNYCKTFELLFCRTFHVSVFIVQYRCEGCVVEGMSGWNGRHGREREFALYSEGMRRIAFSIWLIDWVLRAKLFHILPYICQCKVYQIYGWGGGVVMLFGLDSFSYYTIIRLVHHRKHTASSSKEQIVKAAQVNSCFVLWQLHKTHKYIALGNAQFFIVTAGNNVHSNKHTVT